MNFLSICAFLSKYAQKSPSEITPYLPQSTINQEKCKNKCTLHFLWFFIWVQMLHWAVLCFLENDEIHEFQWWCVKESEILECKCHKLSCSNCIKAMKEYQATRDANELVFVFLRFVLHVSVLRYIVEFCHFRIWCQKACIFFSAISNSNNNLLHHIVPLVYCSYKNAVTMVATLKFLCHCTKHKLTTTIDWIMEMICIFKDLEMLEQVLKCSKSIS